MKAIFIAQIVGFAIAPFILIYNCARARAEPAGCSEMLMGDFRVSRCVTDDAICYVMGAAISCIPH